MAKPDDKTAPESGGVQYHCDVCGLDISSTVRISCATCENQPGATDTYDLCCSCFLEGAESANHKAWHDYRVVEQHSYPIFCDDWGADEELLLIDGAQIYGLGNWADIADHIGNRTKEEVEDHYVKIYIEGKDGTPEGDARSEEIVNFFLSTRTPAEAKKQQLPIAGPNTKFKASVDAEEFQKRKRQRIENLREDQAAFGLITSSQTKDGARPVPPKPLVSAPTSHSELAGFMPGRLEFENEYEQDAENFVKDMEFGKVYRFGGEMMPSELEALGGAAEKGKSRMEASGRGGPSLGSGGATKGNKRSRSEEEEGREGLKKPKEKTESDEEGEEEDEAVGKDMEEEEEDDDDEGEDGNKDEEEDKDEDMEDAEDASQMDASMMDVDDSQAVTTIDEQATASGTTVSKATDTSNQAPPAESDERAADWDEDEADLDLKLTVLEIYNERLDRRGRRKEFIFGRNLIDYKRNIAAERKRPKEEREILNRVRHFAQMQTPIDFEDFYNGLCYEDALRRAAAQLQMYRRAGITNLTDAAKFDSEQAERARKALVAAEGGLAAFPLGGALPRSASGRNARDVSAAALGVEDADSGTATPTIFKANKKGGNDDKKPSRKPPKPLDLSQHPSLNLLTRAEQELCSVVRIQPQVFMIMKKDIIVEYVRRKGRFTRRESRVLFKCDVNKVGKVYDLLESEGYLQEAARLGNGWDGNGVPPGWVERAPPPIAKKGLESKDVALSSPTVSIKQATASPAPPETPSSRLKEVTQGQESISTDDQKNHNNNNNNIKSSSSSSIGVDANHKQASVDPT